ncbi:hypothetical protein AAMO2058_001139900 [Amorphochlora amoebiformis]
MDNEASYIAEKRQIGKKINKKLSEVLTNLKSLNRNVQSLNQVSVGVNEIAGIWEGFLSKNLAEKVPETKQ